MSIQTGETAVASDFINKSEKDAVPANDAGRVPKLEANGLLDPSFLGSVDTFTYNEAGDIVTAKDTTVTPNITYTFSYTGDFLTSITDGTRTWSITWTNDQITSIIQS